MIDNYILAMMAAGDKDKGKDKKAGPGKPAATVPAPALAMIPNAEKKANAMSSTDDRIASLGDMVNYMAASGGNPLSTEQGKVFMKTAPSLIGDDQTRAMIDALTIHNQRSDMKGASKESRLQGFYDIKSANPMVEEVKGKLKRIGYGPMQQYLSTPDVSVQDIQATAKN